MRNAYAIVLAGLGAAAIAGAAAAASRDTHTMNVPLPDGSTARVDYVGDVAPKVTITPARRVSPFSLFDRSMFDMQRQIDAMMREVDAIARIPALAAAPGVNVAAYGSAPEGSSSVTVVSTSNGSKTCMRTTEVTGQGAGKPPKVMTNVSGDCGPRPAPAPAKPTA